MKKKKKFTVEETVQVKRTYIVEAEGPDAAVDAVYSGKLQPSATDEDCASVYVFDENGKNVSLEEGE